MDETTFILYQLQQIEGCEQPELDKYWPGSDAVEPRSIANLEFASISKNEGKNHVQSVHIHVLPTPGTRFTQSMETFADSVSSWPGMYFEMDGSFVWVHESTSENQRSQVDGMIYDREDLIEYVDLKGPATRKCWLAILNTIVCESATNPNLEVLDSKIRIHMVALGEFKTVQQFLSDCNS